MTTYAELKGQVDSWLARDDIAVSNSDFPFIMKIAESMISRDIKCIVQEVSTTLTFTGRSQDLPADFLEVRNPFIDDNTRKFEYKTPQAIREDSSWQNGRVGSFYTLEGSVDSDLSAADDRVKMTISAPASASDPLSIDVNYYRRFPALTDDSDTNWLLNNHFDIYLYCTLCAACKYTQEYAKADQYYSMYIDAKDAQNRAENRKRFAAVPKQSYANPRGVV